MGFRGRWGSGVFGVQGSLGFRSLQGSGVFRVQGSSGFKGLQGSGVFRVQGSSGFRGLQGSGCRVLGSGLVEILRVLGFRVQGGGGGKFG